MQIERRRRGLNQGKTVSFTDYKLNITFGIDVLDLLCAYVKSSNSYIKNSGIISIRNLMALIDETGYKNDPEKYSRLKYIKKGIEARQVAGLQNAKFIDAYIREGGLDEFNFNPPEIGTSEVDYINEMVAGILSWAFIDKEIDKTLDICNRFKAADYASRSSIMEEYIEHISHQNSKFRQIKANTRNDVVFTLDAGKMESVFSDVYDTLTDPSRFLYCGMAGLNEMINGGFEATRTYLFAGTSGVGKSLLLLNLGYQFKMCNKGYKPKDPTKIPTVLYLTQENSVEETVDRLQHFITGKDIKDLPKEEILDILRTEGELVITDDNPINFMIMYKPDRSIDTSDLYGIIEDLEDDGYEVICLIQDHIKRLRSVEKCKELRIELGCIVNELKTLANIKQIVVITDTHLNRDATDRIDKAATANKSDLTKLLGRSNIGESMLMIDNIDYGFIINKDEDKEGNPLMAFSLIKRRNGYSERDFLYYPFMRNNRIRLVTDFFDDVPKFLETNGDPEGNIGTFNKDGVKVKQSSYTSFLESEEEDNLFEFKPKGQSYNMNNPFGGLDVNFENFDSYEDEEEKISPFYYVQNSNTKYAEL